jgi:hypothetical protein
MKANFRLPVLRQTPTTQNMSFPNIKFKKIGVHYAVDMTRPPYYNLCKV